MRGGFALGIGEHHGGIAGGGGGTDGDEELVDGHGGVDGEFAALEGGEGDFFDGGGGFVGEEFGEVFDSHGFVLVWVLF